jgi:hypothetical protein
MINTSETTRCEYDEQGELQAIQTTEDRAKRHPVLGKYVKVMIVPRDSEIKREFFANNDYQCNTPMNTPVIIPEGFMAHINTACYSIESSYDEHKLDPATGHMGMTTKRKIPDFFCSIVE